MTTPSDERVHATFCFVDVAGYTALTEAHGDHAAADLIDRFQALVAGAVEDRGCVLDVVGDAALLMCREPGEAVTAVAELFAAMVRESHFPVLRAGLHHGAVLPRGGRYFGTTVNLAARVAAQARGGQCLATDQVAQAAHQRDIKTTDLGLFHFRNLTEPVQLHELHLEDLPADLVIDPVCRMQVHRHDAAGSLRFADTEYWFCSLSCAAAFAAAPERYHHA